METLSEPCQVSAVTPFYATQNLLCLKTLVWNYISPKQLNSRTNKALSQLSLPLFLDFSEVRHQSEKLKQRAWENCEFYLRMCCLFVIYLLVLGIEDEPIGSVPNIMHQTCVESLCNTTIFRLSKVMRS